MCGNVCAFCFAIAILCLVSVFPRTFVVGGGPVIESKNKKFIETVGELLTSKEKSEKKSKKFSKNDRHGYTPTIIPPLHKNNAPSNNRMGCQM